jgi:hypothetical protein
MSQVSTTASAMMKSATPSFGDSQFMMARPYDLVIRFDCAFLVVSNAWRFWTVVQQFGTVGNVQSSKTFKECLKFGSPIHDTKRVMFLTCTLSFICCLVYPMMHFEENIVRGVLYPALVGILV